MIENVLVADDELSDRELMREVLLTVDEGLSIRTATNGKEACHLLKSQDFDAVFTDLRMPARDGLEVLECARGSSPPVEVVMATGYGEVTVAVDAMRRGCFDFLLKPITVDKVEVVLDRLGRSQRLTRDSDYLRAQFDSAVCTRGIVGSSEPFRRACAQALQVSKTDATVLLQGESGTGKELIARLIHESSPRKEKPFIRVNCAALSESLLESELFGHKKGAFTGADSDRVGRFEMADKGTLLLDEITETSSKLQAELLRVIEAREFQRVGSSKTIKVDTRIIATTNRDLASEVASGNFREDLYYRLNVVPVKLPPLRQRSGDVEILSRHFAEQVAEELSVTPPEISEEVLDEFRQYPWPGNVRELQNLMKRLLILDQDGVITRDDLPAHLDGTGVRPDDERDWGPKLEDIERQAILDALRNAGGNRTRAAEKLGISARTIRNKLNKYAEAGCLPEDFSHR